MALSTQRSIDSFTMSYSNHLRTIAHTAENSAWYQASSNDTFRFFSKAAVVQYTPVLPASEVVEYRFVLPNPLTTDFLALGLSESTSKELSSNYLRASMELKAAYEAEFRRSTTACFRIIRMFRLALPDLQARRYSTYASRYTSTVNLWAEQQMSVTRQRLMQMTLSARYHATFPLQTFVAKPGKNAPATEKHVSSSQVQSSPLKSRLRKPKIDNMVLEATSHECPSKSDNESGGICNVVDLTSSFSSQSSILKFEDEGLLHHDAPSHIFPTVYHPRPVPFRGDSCMKILSRGLRRTISSQTTNMDGLIQAFGRLFPEALSNCKSSCGTNGSCGQEKEPAGRHSPARSLPTSLSSDLSVASLPTVLRPPVFSPLTKLRDSRDSLEPPSVSLSPQHPVLKAHRWCGVSRLTTSTDAHLPQSLSSVSVASSPRVEKLEPPLLAITVPNTASTSVSHRRRKVAKLPTRRASTTTSTSPIPAPTTPNASSLAPLNVVNVSSLSRPSFPFTRSRTTISRTPSLVSLTSSDSESSSPSSDGLDTPPSTPPPFVTKFPSPISPSSSSSKSFTPKFDSAVSPGNLFQVSSAKQPKIFEAHLPSGAPPFGFSAGIKREEVSFSFAFGR